jgi:hypothetical protein
MKKKINLESAWTFVIKKDETPSQNIKRLVEQLSISKLMLFTNQRLKQKHGYKYELTRISMAGTARYVDDRLLEIYKALKESLDEYIISKESVINKKYELSFSINLINEAVLLNNESLEFEDKVNEISLFKENTNEVKKITIEEIQLQLEIAEEMNSHLKVRAKYLSMLASFLHILKERVDLDELNKDLVPKAVNNLKEINLLEIWEGLIVEKFLDGCSEEELTKKRSIFFSVFNLKDRLYNSRHREMKKKKSLGDFTIAMAENLKEAYGINPPKKI